MLQAKSNTISSFSVHHEIKRAKRVKSTKKLQMLKDAPHRSLIIDVSIPLRKTIVIIQDRPL